MLQISDPSDNFLLEDKVQLGEVREISKDIKLQGVHQMCFKHACEWDMCCQLTWRYGVFYVL